MERADDSLLGTELNLVVYLMSLSFNRLSEQSACIIFVHLL